MTDEIQQFLKAMRLRKIAEIFDSELATADKEQRSYQDFVVRLLPVEWILFTTEPAKTKKQILRVVDIYRTRWLPHDPANLPQAWPMTLQNRMTLAAGRKAGHYRFNFAFSRSSRAASSCSSIKRSLGRDSWRLISMSFSRVSTRTGCRFTVKTSLCGKSSEYPPAKSISPSTSNINAPLHSS